jgi:uncharacterized protein (TIGR03000 family)
MAYVQAPAQLTVTLPADATLTIDGKPTTSTTGLRVFRTPVLERGSDYVYTLRAQIMRDGQPESIAREVTVRAGEETRVDLSMPSSVASR